MNALQGTIKNRRIILDAPAALPEGTRVEALPMLKSDHLPMVSRLWVQLNSPSSAESFGSSR